MTQDIVLRQYQDEAKLNQLHIEREQTQSMHEFQQWLKDMRIGSRIEVKDKRAEELNQQYDFRKLNNEGHSWMPQWVRNLYQ